MGYFEKHLFAQPQVPNAPSEKTGIIVTIPCYNEPGLITVLDSLEACEEPGTAVEVIIHVNASDESPGSVQAQNKLTIENFNAWNHGRRHTYFLLHSPALPERHAGVGLARKIAMDEAAYRFHRSQRENGVIVCLDADCTVEKNYLAEIERTFRQDPGLAGCSLYFEHPLSGVSFPSSVYEAIINYELFLRYYVLALQWCRFPYPYHTIGSSMAVRAEAYMKLGGMNRRKAGEDFYFLHKLFPFGKFRSVNTTTVYPSPRISDRVPFGTGAAVSKQLLGVEEEYTTYHFQSFRDLRNFFSLLPEYYYKNKFADGKIPDSIKDFLHHENLEESLREIKSHTATESSFTKRFFTYFDGFKILKFIHHSRDHFYPNTEVRRSVRDLLEAMGHTEYPEDKRALLLMLRFFEKEK